MARVSSIRVIALLGIAYVITACGTNRADAVEAKVKQYAHAVATRDPKMLCQQVLAPDLVAHLTAAGISCEQAMATFVVSVQDPTISIAKIHVHRTTADATVLAAAHGQQASLGTLELVSTKGGWRVQSLVSPR